MAIATAQITPDVLEDRYAGTLFVEDEPTAVYEALNGALFDIALNVARRGMVEDVGQVVEEAHAALRDLIVNRTHELGLAR